jgi:hypothetical protein
MQSIKFRQLSQKASQIRGNCSSISTKIITVALPYYKSGRACYVRNRKIKYPMIAVSVPTSCVSINFGGDSLKSSMSLVKEVSQSEVTLELYQEIDSDLVLLSFLDILWKAFQPGSWRSRRSPHCKKYFCIKSDLLGNSRSCFWLKMKDAFSSRALMYGYPVSNPEITSVPIVRHFLSFLICDQ